MARRLLRTRASLKERSPFRQALSRRCRALVRKRHPEILDDVWIEQRPMMHDVPPGAGSVDARPRMDGDARWPQRQYRRWPTWDRERALSERRRRQYQYPSESGDRVARLGIGNKEPDQRPGYTGHQAPALIPSRFTSGVILHDGERSPRCRGDVTEDLRSRNTTSDQVGNWPSLPWLSKGNPMFADPCD